MYGYVYKTTNLINNKIYIGQHRSDNFDAQYLGSGKLIRRAFKKYGIENFKCEVIEWCETKEQLIAREIYWIHAYKAQDKCIGYNISNGGEGILSPMPEVMREHLRICNTGKKLSDETRKKLKEKHSGENNGFYGKQHTVETKQHISDVLREQYQNGRINAMTGVHRYGKDAPRYGAILSEETKRKISNSVSGFKHTDEAKHKMSNNAKGRVYVNNGVKNKKVKPEELDFYLLNGYVIGRLTPWQ